MWVEQLELEGFRNYGMQAVDFHPQCNVIWGENAQGKTNLLEAVAYLSCGRSPRTRTDRELIGFERQEAVLTAFLQGRERKYQVRAELSRERRRRLFVNQVPAKTNAALSEVYHTVLFRPEDLFLIREGASVRRKFLDNALCQLRPRYAAALAKYHRAQEQKTRILRDAEKHPEFLQTLPEFNSQMIFYGAALVHYRAWFIGQLTEYAAVHHRECSGGREALTLRYQTVSSVRDPNAGAEELMEDLRQHMESHQAAELASRSCLSGPHKDDLIVEIDGREAKSYSSQGQTRTAALALKLAEREIYQADGGVYPILLLDDVLSELDQRRQDFVLNRISGGQVFITCCEEDRLSQMLGGKVFHVEHGTIL